MLDGVKGRIRGSILPAPTVPMATFEDTFDLDNGDKNNDNGRRSCNIKV